MSALSENDKYYTKGSLVDTCFQEIESVCGKVTDFPLVVEPSAGAGAFVERLVKENCEFIALDIEPEGDLILKADWLCDSFEIPTGSLVVGNPPFGKNSSLAVKFFNKAASYQPAYVCFILPRTFMKQRFWKRLDKGYTLVYHSFCPDNSFLLNGTEHDVPCVFQIWKKQARKCDLPEVPFWFCEVSPDKADCFIRRAGASAGTVVETYTPSSTYSVTCPKEVIEMVKSNEKRLQAQASLTSGVKSITLLEIEDILRNRY